MEADRMATRYIVSLRQRYQMYRELTEPVRDRMLGCGRGTCHDAEIHRYDADRGAEEITPW
jgi:hypothetical protein